MAAGRNFTQQNKIMNLEHYETLKEIVKVYLPEDVSAEAISKESNFIDELNINSANLVDIVLDVEDAFDIMLENDDMDQMTTVNDALAIIDKKLNAK
jgi:acyl carrier protein